jgi:hypothetical protein
MKRKRAQARKSTDLRTVDKESQSYWEEVLARENLRMTRGNDTRLVYVGDGAAVERIHNEVISDMGRVEPHSAGE